MPSALVLRQTSLQRLMRLSGFRNRLFPPDKLDRWAADPRAPYSGTPPVLVRRRAMITRADLDGRAIYHVVPKRIGAASHRGHMLYLHGGGYVTPLVPFVHWPFIVKLATVLRRTVTVPTYPLAPEHTYRDVFPFLRRLYDRLLVTHPADDVMFAGDSAGGSMALALCHALRDAGLAQPAALLMFSPWLDVRITAPEAEAVARIDPALNIEHLRDAGRRYAGHGPLDSPLVSPGLGPLDGLPSMTIFTGTHDLLDPDIRAFRRRAIAEGVEVGWHELDGGLHCWPMMPGRHTRAAFDAMRAAYG
jgi:acetyl esterase/lipase